MKMSFLATSLDIFLYKLKATLLFLVLLRFSVGIFKLSQKLRLSLRKYNVNSDSE